MRLSSIASRRHARGLALLSSRATSFVTLGALVTLATSIGASAGCGGSTSSNPNDADDPDGAVPATSCPPGPQAPLASACASEGLECRYGYVPLSCGGRTVRCQTSVWVEKEHTDPQAGCFDAGNDAGGDASADAGACPAGPEAPLGGACTTAGVKCRYGYAPLVCGGRTVVCQGGTWTELEHTDPQPACFRDAGDDAGSAKAASCRASGGQVASASCCSAGSGFPSSCGVGACSCAPASSRITQVCECPANTCFDGSACVTR